MPFVYITIDSSHSKYRLFRNGTSRFGTHVCEELSYCQGKSTLKKHNAINTSHKKKLACTLNLKLHLRYWHLSSPQHILHLISHSLFVMLTFSSQLDSSCFFYSRMQRTDNCSYRRIQFKMHLEHDRNMKATYEENEERETLVSSTQIQSPMKCEWAV